MLPSLFKTVLRVIEYRNTKFQATSVDMDGKAFIDCTFEGCTIRFSGIAPMSVTGCTFTNCSLALADSASLTISYLKAIYHGLGEWGKKSVENLFEDIRKGPTR